MNTTHIVTIIVTVILAFFSSVATYLNNFRLTQRKEQLQSINRQLGEFDERNQSLFVESTAY